MGRTLLGADAIGGGALHGALPGGAVGKEALHLDGDRREEAVAVVGEVAARIVTGIERKITPIEVAGSQIF